MCVCVCVCVSIFVCMCVSEGAMYNSTLNERFFLVGNSDSSYLPKMQC